MLWHTTRSGTIIGSILGLALLSSATPLRAATVRLALIAGNNVGTDGELPLQFAETDAERFGDLLAELGGFDRSRIRVMTNGSVDRLQGELDQFRGRIAEIRAQGDDPLFVFYFSGHGDRETLHLAASTLPLSNLRQGLSALGASVTIGIIDACHSGSISRVKGGVPDQPFEVLLEADPTPKGTVLISSSSPDELAQESIELKSSLFSHHFISALRGAADYDLDGRVTLREAYMAAYDATLTQSMTRSPQRQHPMADIDITGHGDIVLTYLAKSSGSIIFPASSEGLYTIVNRTNQRVVAEVTKSADRPRQIALPAGEYQLYKQEQKTYLTGPINLAWGGRHPINERILQRIPYAIYASKGVPLRIWRNRVGLRTQVASGVQPGMNGTGAFGLEYLRFVSSGTSVSGAVSYMKTEFVPEYTDPVVPPEDVHRRRHEDLTVEFSLRRHYLPFRAMPFLSPVFGGFLEVSRGSQHLQNSLASESYTSFGSGIRVDLEAALPAHWTASCFGGALLAWTTLPSSSGDLPGAIQIPGDENYGIPLLSDGSTQNVILWRLGLTLSRSF